MPRARSSTRTRRGGTKIGKGSTVTLTSRPACRRCRCRTCAARARPTRSRRSPQPGSIRRSRSVYSTEQPDTVTGAVAAAGDTVDEGLDVRINVSRGREAGRGAGRDRRSRTRTRSRRSQGQGFRSTRVDIQSDQAARASSSPRIRRAGTQRRRRARRSRCPSRRARRRRQVPDVTSQTPGRRDSRSSAAPASPSRRSTQPGHRPEPGRRSCITQDPAAGTTAKPGEIVTITVGQLQRHARRRRHDDDHDDRTPTPVTRRIAVILGGRSSEHAISLASARERDRRARGDAATRWSPVADRPRRALAARLGAGARRARLERARLRRSRGSRPRRSRRRWPTSTSSSRCCTARSARTARCRACSSSPASPTSARACSPPRSAWTRTSSSRCCATTASRSRENITLRARRRAAQPVRLSVLRQAGAARLERRHHEGARRGRAARRRRARVRSTTRRCSSSSSSPAIEVEVGVLGNLRADRVAAGRDRRHAQRVVRLRGEVRRGRDGPRRPGARHRRADRARAGAGRRARSSRPTAKAWRASTCSSATTARCS